MRSGDAPIFLGVGYFDRSGVAHSGVLVSNGFGRSECLVVLAALAVLGMVNVCGWRLQMIWWLLYLWW